MSVIVYGVDVEKNKLVFNCACDEDVSIHSITLECDRPTFVGWVEIWVLDHLMYKGPSPWFKSGGISLALTQYMNMRLIFVAFDEVSEWFHGAHPRLELRAANGNKIEVKNKGRFDHLR